MTPLARAEIQALLVRLGDGDRAAIEPAFRALWPLLRRFSARALSNEAEAEDAAQQVLVRVSGQVSNFDRDRDGVAWVLTIASFECRSARRRVARRREDGMEAESATIAECGSPEELVLQRDLETAARETLGDLREEDARAILAAIAEARPTNDATFRKRLQRAIGRLRLAWRTKHGT